MVQDIRNYFVHLNPLGQDCTIRDISRSKLKLACMDSSLLTKSSTIIKLAKGVMKLEEILEANISIMYHKKQASNE